MLVNLLLLTILQLVTNSLAATCDKYNVKYPSKSDVFKNINELFDRHKCTTCCRVMIVSDHMPEYAMDMEFEYESQVREATGDWEQTILMKPINMHRDLQKFELNAYKMISVFNIPKRVHDIRGGIKLGSKLIIWKKKAPLDVGTNNQRFVYHHPYTFYNYKNEFKYPKHFQAPFYTASDVCYEVHSGTPQVWTGNNHVNRPQCIGKDYQYGFDEYQVKIAACDEKNERQRFTLVYV
jgi:galactose-inhibitable lectin light subunit